MISKNDVTPFLNKMVHVLYMDSGKELLVLGELKNISDSSMTIQTDYNLMVISFDSIKKVKMSLTENE